MIGDDRSADLAAAMMDFRRARSEILPAELFAEPAWDLLLELFVADANGTELSGADVSKRCNIAPSVLSRWLCHLSQCQLIIGDGTGDLTDPLTLSGEGLASMERAMTHAYNLQAALKDVEPPKML